MLKTTGGLQCGHRSQLTCPNHSTGSRCTHTCRRSASGACGSGSKGLGSRRRGPCAPCSKRMQSQGANREGSKTVLAMLKLHVPEAVYMLPLLASQAGASPAVCLLRRPVHGPLHQVAAPLAATAGEGTAAQIGRSIMATTVANDVADRHSGSSGMASCVRGSRHCCVRTRAAARSWLH